MITWNLRLHVVKSISSTEPDNTIGWAMLWHLKSEALPRMGEVVALHHESFRAVFDVLRLGLVDQSVVTNVEHSVSAGEEGGSVMVVVRTTARYGASTLRLSELPHWTPFAD
ncbi:hypothetical protein [Clavibacter sp. VKM Ac-2872]|uniref:hypothetical protein n=1 Tax=Clavibacter sp. VKM Ac-2872 TaxID=2783812 RepID=UPI00188B0FC6|nr:hypothetical protein [Clavibacter sp. VKM Ac-2872]MBF4625782.1 hypothetical protein [Clavibacter sp. VKM Ac-2872]